MAVDPNSTTTAAAATIPSSSSVTATTSITSSTSRPLTNPPHSRPISPLPPEPHSHSHPHQSPSLFPPLQLQIRSSSPQLNKPHDPPTQGVVYPLASSGRGFMPQVVRPNKSSIQGVIVANTAGYPPRPVASFPHGVRAMDAIHQMMRPPNLQYPNLISAIGAGTAPVKGVPVPAHPEAAPQPANSESNGYKDPRKRSRDESYAIVRDRKVKLVEGTSLYALCRSWLRNGISEESQSQHSDGIKALPKPLPTSMVDTISKKKDGEGDDEDKEDEESAENLSPQDLLQRHIKHARKVRAQLREERLQKIARYRSRLRLLIPPPVEQFRNDMPVGN